MFDGEDLTLRDIETGCNGVYVGKSKNAELFCHFLDFYVKDAMNILPVTLEINQLESPEALPHLVQIVAVEC